jgi:hypothetical protein
MLLNIQKYELMHKDIKVFDIDIQKRTDNFLSIGKIYQPDHVPLGMFRTEDSDLTKLIGLMDWWNDRLIPDNRSNLRHILETCGVISVTNIAMNSLGLSLIDHYWLRPEGSGLTWSEVNFYDNPFKEEAGDVFITTRRGKHDFKRHGDKINIKTPDSTTGGALIKKWANIDGIISLCKFGTPILPQEPANEALASEILNRLKLPHVPYSLKFYNKAPMSVCPNFLTKETELVSARWMLKSTERINEQTILEQFIKAAETIGVPETKKNLDNMLIFDFLIGNMDRHFSNFGMIRNASTLQPICLAPIFDNGFSFWHQKLTDEINIKENIKSLPFEDTHNDQIRIVDNFNNIDLALIKDMDDIIIKTFSQIPSFTTNRAEKIAKGFEYRIKSLENIINSLRPEPSNSSNKTRKKSRMR